MSDYKLDPKVPKSADFIQREADFMEQLKALKASKAEVVDDFQRPLSKDRPAQKITTRDIVPQTTGADFLAKQQARAGAVKAAAGVADNVYDAGSIRKQYEAMKQMARNPVAKKALGVLPLVAPAMAMMSGDASAAADELAADAMPVYDAIRPTPSGPAQGSFDQRLEQGTLTTEEKQQMMMEQARVRALQGM